MQRRMRRVEPIPLMQPHRQVSPRGSPSAHSRSRPSTPSSRFGFLPPIWIAPVVIIAFVIAAWLLRLSTGSSLPLFFSLIVVLPWIPGRVPAAFLLWTGPVVYVVWMTVAVSMLVAERRWLDVKLRSAPVVAAAVAFTAYLAAGWWLFAILPNGDEPHYLVITQSVAARWRYPCREQLRERHNIGSTFRARCVRTMAEAVSTANGTRSTRQACRS